MEEELAANVLAFEGHEVEKGLGLTGDFPGRFGLQRTNEELRKRAKVLTQRGGGALVF